MLVTGGCKMNTKQIDKTADVLPEKIRTHNAQERKDLSAFALHENLTLKAIYYEFRDAMPETLRFRLGIVDYEILKTI